MNLAKHLRQNPIDFLLLAVPLAILALVTGWGPVAVLALAALGVLDWRSSFCLWLG